MPQATEPGHSGGFVRREHRAKPHMSQSAQDVPPRANARLTDDALTATTAPKALSVADVVSRIKALIEHQFPSPVWVEGELSNCSYPASGHIYFSLVDERVTDRFPGPTFARAGAGGQRFVLPCAFFRSANQHLKFRLEDGMKIVCFGQVTTYERQGQYQLRVLRVLPKGKGELQVALEQLKKRLGEEGLFDEARKRPIPRSPHRVGVITSRSGSAIHDIVSKLRGHFHVVVLPVKVQGEGASTEIADALDEANALHLADVLIVGRGGGSVEDLWAFNEEPVARAIARSRIPVISAVGHQDDWTIADYVADRRASTPTDAAKGLVQEQQALVDQCQDLVQRLVETMQVFLEHEEAQVHGMCDRLRLLHPLHQLNDYERRITQSAVHLTQSMRHTLEQEDRRLQGLAGRLQALSPLAVLARGYSITFALPAHRVVTDSACVKAGDEIETLVARGRIVSAVTHVSSQPTSEYHGADT